MCVCVCVCFNALSDIIMWYHIIMSLESCDVCVSSGATVNTPRAKSTQICAPFLNMTL